MKSRPEIELLLSCARVELDAPRAARVRELLREDLDWQLLTKMALRNGVMPLVYRQLSRNFADAVPEIHLRRLRELFRHNGARNLLRAGELCRILESLSKHGIDAIPYKGPALAVDAYGDLSLRQFSDLDILVRRSDVRRAIEALSAEGYEPEFELSETERRVFMRWWYVLAFSRGDRIYHLELHWAIAPHFFSFPFETERLWSRRRSLRVAEREIHAPSREDLLLLLSAHGAKDSWARLEWICAVAELIRADGDLDWKALMREARATGAERMLLLALNLAQELLEAELPEEILQKIRGSASLRALTAQVSEHLFREKKRPAGFIGKTLFHLKTRENLSDKVRYCARVATATSPFEWRLVPLPESLYFIYSLLRPVRLFAGFVSGRTKRELAQASVAGGSHLDASKQASE
ncbi:MAG TPA: nucleotidyltransferase family protein [Pyrinomonadaceae bacterium]